MNTIVKMIFGSNLYGTNTPDSDQDFKGIYLPSPSECYLGKIQKSINTSTGKNNFKNTKDDIDEEIFSLQYFLELGKNGEMIVIDMLHAPSDLIISTSPIWRVLQANRKRLFYSKNLSGYLSYIRTQTAKYGIKGSRLAAMKNLKEYLYKSPNLNDKMSTIWDNLPINKYCFHIDNSKENRWNHYECCGKQIISTQSIENAFILITNMYNSYGERAKQAEANNGIDWKAVSHAFRAGYQLNELYTTEDLKYPLKDAEFLKDLKLGKFHYKNDLIGEKLEKLYDDIIDLSNKSKFPDKVSDVELDNFIVGCYE